MELYLALHLASIHSYDLILAMAGLERYDPWTD